MASNNIKYTSEYRMGFRDNGGIVSDRIFALEKA